MSAATPGRQVRDPRSCNGQRLRRIQFLGIVGKQKCSDVANHRDARRRLFFPCGFQLCRQFLQRFGQNRACAPV